VKKALLFSLVFLSAGGLGWFLGFGRHVRAMKASGRLTAKSKFATPPCETVRSMFLYFKGVPGQQNEVDWQVCRDPDSSSPSSQIVHVRDESDEDRDLWTFGPADFFQQLTIVDFLRDGRQELLEVEESGGTGHYTEWAVLGRTNSGLRCWRMPNVNEAANKLIRSDEGFGSKGWTLKLTSGHLVVGEGIYHEGDGACCPSRGGVFLELTPKQGDEFVVSKAWRADAQTFDRWVRSP